MFRIEDGAMEYVDNAMQRYQEFFTQDFPLYEYLDITSGNYFDVSIGGAKKLAKFIDDRIKQKKAVDIPKEYNERVY